MLHGSYIFLAIGCAIVGDGLVKVEGRILTAAGEPVTDCDIELSLVNYDGTYGQNKVSGNFLVSFVIGGEKEEYYFTIRCPDYEKEYTTKIFTFSGNTYDRRPLDIGRIVM